MFPGSMFPMEKQPTCLFTKYVWSFWHSDNSFFVGKLHRLCECFEYLFMETIAYKINVFVLVL